MCTHHYASPWSYMAGDHSHPLQCRDGARRDWTKPATRYSYNANVCSHHVPTKTKSSIATHHRVKKNTRPVICQVVRVRRLENIRSQPVYRVNGKADFHSRSFISTPCATSSIPYQNDAGQTPHAKTHKQCNAQGSSTHAGAHFPLIPQKMRNARLHYTHITYRRVLQ